MQMVIIVSAIAPITDSTPKPTPTPTPPPKTDPFDPKNTDKGQQPEITPEPTPTVQTANIILPSLPHMIKTIEVTAWAGIRRWIGHDGVSTLTYPYANDVNLETRLQKTKEAECDEKNTLFKVTITDIKIEQEYTASGSIAAYVYVTGTCDYVKDTFRAEDINVSLCIINVNKGNDNKANIESANHGEKLDFKLGRNLSLKVGETFTMNSSIALTLIPGETYNLWIRELETNDVGY